jgi:hypothetical protein
MHSLAYMALMLWLVLLTHHQVDDDDDDDYDAQPCMQG